MQRLTRISSPNCSRKHDEDLLRLAQASQRECSARRCDELRMPADRIRRGRLAGRWSAHEGPDAEAPQRSWPRLPAAVARLQTTPSQKAAPSRPITLTEPTHELGDALGPERQQDAQRKQAAGGRSPDPEIMGVRTGSGPRGRRNSA